MSGKSFALELNLGFPSHYEYLKSIVGFNPLNQVHLLLFFTDKLTLCLDRASIRHLNGGHEVKQEIIEEMYAATIPLFQQNANLFFSVRLLDVQNTTMIEPNQRSKNVPDWISQNNLQVYLSG